MSNSLLTQRCQALPCLQNRAQNFIKLIMGDVNWDDEEDYPDDMAEWLTAEYGIGKDNPLMQKLELFVCTILCSKLADEIS